jgi:hypothetical protein
MEKHVLIALDYHLTFPTAMHFLGQLGEGMHPKAMTLARYMLEITAASRPLEWSQTLPSVMAKAAMLLASQFLAAPVPAPALQQVSSPQVEKLVNEMRVWVNTPKPKKWDGIREKYARTR